MEHIIHPGISIGETNEFYFQKIRKLCEEEGMVLLLIKTPNMEWGSLEHALTSELAEKNNIPFYDYNTCMNEIGIWEECCFLDGAHLNYIGAEK